eukprot:CAMPEP_0117421390 /NCGR_PEP_ID=MMETSP0758-20121206/2500_1 /TAXON_ID=63605 /ORGANISM="Percolomonas cosmopolitus, Strain AE-1 (ATCC 50343)" /LENGTH=409 /DNA_ID=CAMNT_0005203503 /DNA_START=14 /DNA_END=1240 /DNA_ORIENTATION=-
MPKEKVKFVPKTAPLLADVFADEYGISKEMQEDVAQIKDKTELVATLMSGQSFGPSARTNQIHQNQSLEDLDEEDSIEGEMARKILFEARKQQNNFEDPLGEPQVHLDDIDEDYQKYANQPEDAHCGPFRNQNYMKMDSGERILQQIREKEKAKGERMLSNNEADLTKKLDARIVKMYKSIGYQLQKYRSGKFPKAMRMMPMLQRWEEALYFSRPERWSYQAVFQATRIFTSGVPDPVAQRYFYLVLLPRFRAEMEEAKKLNYHIYEALKRACFRPVPFFKGIVIPLCEEGNANRLESIVIGSIIKKKHLPIEHAAAAMMMIINIEYNSTYDSILKAFLEKRYSLPNPLIDALVDDYFFSFIREERVLPMIWHQVLLSFVQIYKNELSRDQKRKILAVCRKHHHHQITA